MSEQSHAISAGAQSVVREKLTAQVRAYFATVLSRIDRCTDFSFFGQDSWRASGWTRMSRRISIA